MNLPRRAVLVLLACWLAAGLAAGQSPSPFGEDERAARVAERYKAMLAANPAEGVALDRLWKAHEERNATGALLDEYRRAADDGKPAAVLIYGHLLKRAGRLDDAAAAYERAAKADPANPLPLVAQAELAGVRGRPAEAAALYEQALGTVPAADRRRADWLMRLGDAWLAAGQPLKASEAWEKLVEADPSNLALRRQLAVNYEKNGLSDRAIVHYEYLDAHADPAGRAAALRELGRLREARGDFDGSRDAFERGLAITARDNWLYGELQGGLIRLYQRAGRAAELAARWEAAVAKAPRDLGGYTRLIALAEAQGDPVGARVWLEKLVALAPRDREHSLKLARLLADEGETGRAAALYDGLLKVQPGNLDLILARAELDLRVNRADEADRRIEDRVAQNPGDESVSVPALQFFLSHHLDDSAQKLLRAAVARQPAATDASLALAKFYLARHRDGEAREVFDALARQPGDPAARSARWAVAAECYKEANQPAEELRCWQESLALQPAGSAPLAAVGELLLAKGETEAGIAQMERALAAAPEGAARDEIDHKFFQALTDRSQAGDAPAEEAPPRRRGETIILDTSGRMIVIGPAGAGRRREGGVTVSVGRALGEYLARLEKAARETPSAAAYLRLARWQQWARHPRESTVAAEALLKLVPDSLAAREILAEDAVTLHQRAEAVVRLREIATLDPSRKAAALGRVADLLLEDSDFDGALAVLDARVRDEPGSVDALTDLALGQQRADRWFDALATWERAYALPRLTPVQRGNLRRPLVAAHEHLGHFQPAAELLQAAIDAQDDLATRRDLFHELAVFCQSHSLTPWLREVYQRRLDAQPQGYFAMTSMAELHKAAGETREAYDLLKRAYYSAPEPAAALRLLVDEAEALGETTDAVAHERRLVALTGQANPETLAKLAALEEADLDDEAAGRTWEQIAVRFPRDTAALGSAADYFARTRRVGRARELLAQVVALDPGDFARAHQLGELDLLSGDRVAAMACFEGILSHTRPEEPGDPLRVPPELDPSRDASEFLAAASRSAARGRAGADASPAEPTADNKDERGIRLKTIGELSRLIFASGEATNADQRRHWLERWQQAAAGGLRGEPLAAFYGAAQKDAVATLTASWLDSGDPDERENAQEIFLLAGLRMQNYLPLARWTWDNDENGNGARATRLTEALLYFFATGGQPAPGMVAALFPPEIKSHILLWRVATSVFAEKHWFPQAVELGERALVLPGGSAAESFQLAQWEVDLGRIDVARNVLRTAIGNGNGTAYDLSPNNAVFADLRAYYFLLPAAERAGFVADYLKRADARQGGRVHATLAAALLHGLEGNEAGAFRDLERIVEMRLLDGREGSDRWTPDLRRWNYLFAAGAQLQAWNLDNLAAHLWRRAISEASAFDRQDPEVRSTLAEIRLRQLVAEELTAPDPLEAGLRLDEFLREQPSVITMASAASALVSVGQYPPAIRLYEQLCRQMPAEGDFPRSLLNAQDAAGDQAAMDRTLSAMLDGTLPPGSAINRFEVITRLATLRETVGDREGALRLLMDARRQHPRAVAILRTLAQFLERQKRSDDAVAILREAAKYDRGIESVIELAAHENRRGDREAAFRVIRDAKTPDRDDEALGLFVKRIHLYLVAGHQREAIDLAWQWAREGREGGMWQAASVFAAQGQRQVARELLEAAIHSAHDPAVRCLAQQKLVEIFYTAKDAPMDGFAREMRRLEHFTDATPGQRTQYAYDRDGLAFMRGANEWLENELKQDWQEGAGDIAVVGSLATLYLNTKQEEPLRRLVAAVDARPNLPEQALRNLASQLVESGHAPLALPLTERLYRRFPQNVEYPLLRARALWAAGRRDEAAAVLEATDAAGVFRDGAGVQTAALWASFGERGRARASLDTLLARDPYTVRSAQVQIRLAALDLEDHRADDACRLLASAYRSPATAEMEPLVNALAVAGRLDVAADNELPGGDLPLTFLRRAQLLAAVCARLQHDGRANEALRLAGANPGLFAEIPGYVQTLCDKATDEQLPALIKLMEESIARAEFPSPPLTRQLAKLLLRAAESARTPPGEVANLLTRAHEVAPDDFAVTRALAAAFRAGGQNARASELLNPYLTPEALPSERDAARRTLGQP